MSVKLRTRCGAWRGARVKLKLLAGVFVCEVQGHLAAFYGRVLLLEQL